jgi:hypothetical protein
MDRSADLKDIKAQEAIRATRVSKAYRAFLVEMARTEIRADQALKVPQVQVHKVPRVFLGAAARRGLRALLE